MIYQIPLKPVPVQKVSATLGGQEVTVSLLPRLGRLYATVSADGRVLIRERGMPARYAVGGRGLSRLSRRALFS